MVVTISAVICQCCSQCRTNKLHTRISSHKIKLQVQIWSLSQLKIPFVTQSTIFATTKLRRIDLEASLIITTNHIASYIISLGCSLPSILLQTISRIGERKRERAQQTHTRFIYMSIESLCLSIPKL